VWLSKATDLTGKGDEARPLGKSVNTKTRGLTKLVKHAGKEQSKLTGSLGRVKGPEPLGAPGAARLQGLAGLTRTAGKTDLPEKST